MQRVLVIADVHANAPALDAVLDAEPGRDAVYFLGDAVDCGPHPETACERLRGLDVAAGVDGNHDRAVLDAPGAREADADPYLGWQRWTYDRLSEASRSFLGSLDRTVSVTRGGQRLRLHHGDFPPPEGYDGAWPTRVTPDDDAPLFEAVAARYDEDVVLHGHSHYPFDATVAGTRFVNPGSVGLQRAGWPVDRARYAVLEGETVDLRAVRYDPGGVAADSRALDNPFTGDWDRDSPGDAEAHPPGPDSGTRGE